MSLESYRTKRDPRTGFYTPDTTDIQNKPYTGVPYQPQPYKDVLKDDPVRVENHGYQGTLKVPTMQQQTVTEYKVPDMDPLTGRPYADRKPRNNAKPEMQLTVSEIPEEELQALEFV